MLQGRVVFVYEDCHSQSGLLIGSGYYCMKAVCKHGARIGSNVVFLLIILKAQVQVRAQSLFVGSSTAHVKTYDWILLPFFLHLHYLQPIEQVFSSLKVRLQRIDKYRLAESTWAAQVVILIPQVDHVPYDVALVHVEIVFLSDYFKRLNAYWQSPKSVVCHICCLLLALYLRRYALNRNLPNFCKDLFYKG